MCYQAEQFPWPASSTFPNLLLRRAIILYFGLGKSWYQIACNRTSCRVQILVRTSNTPWHRCRYIVENPVIFKLATAAKGYHSIKHLVRTSSLYSMVYVMQCWADLIDGAAKSDTPLNEIFWLGSFSVQGLLYISNLRQVLLLSLRSFLSAGSLQNLGTYLRYPCIPVLRLGTGYLRRKLVINTWGTNPVPCRQCFIPHSILLAALRTACMLSL